MNGIKKRGIYLVVSAAMLLLCRPLFAGEFSFGASGNAEADTKSGVNADGNLEAGVETDEEDEFYQEDIKPGITFHKVEQSQSPLLDAARNRRSISIGGVSKRPAVQEAGPAGKKVHRVKEGDTLWEICESSFGDPYVWPRIWSYNPGITNPNWIYPGDIIWLRPPERQVSTEKPETDEEEPVVQMEVTQAYSSILHRNRGFVDNEALKQVGVIRGAQKINMLLTQYDEAYVEFKKNRDVQVGDEFAIYKVIRDIEQPEGENGEVGKLVEIFGAVRVISFDEEARIARVVIDESMKPIERGTFVGPVHSRFQLVPSRVNEKEMKATVVAHMDNTVLFSQHQVVFINKGSKHGVREGNRFLAVRKRDEYMASLDKKDAHDGFPFEVLAEMRVLETRDETSTCLVTAATRALEDGTVVEMVKGY